MSDAPVRCVFSRHPPTPPDAPAPTMARVWSLLKGRRVYLRNSGGMITWNRDPYDGGEWTLDEAETIASAVRLLTGYKTGTDVDFPSPNTGRQVRREGETDNG